jgi:hypothetical protein
MATIRKKDYITHKEDLIDISLDINGDINENVHIDVNIDLDIDKDDLETIRFESIPERKQTTNSDPVTSFPVTSCSIFGWLFSCFI